MTRPRGTIRAVLQQAAWSLHREQQAFHWRDLMHTAGLAEGYSAREQVAVVKQTVRRMALDGDLLPVGKAPTEHACRPMVLYVPNGPAQAGRCAAASAAAELVQAMQSWRDFK